MNSRKNHLEKGQLNSVISQCSLSLPKDTTNTNDMQQFMDEIIEKSKKARLYLMDLIVLIIWTRQGTIP